MKNRQPMQTQSKRNMHTRWVARSTLVLLSAIIFSSPVIGATAGRQAALADFGAVDEYLRAEMRDLQIPGMAAVIVSGDQIAYTQGFGVADAGGRAVTPQTPMLLGSISKGFTALAVLQLAEAGQLALDAPVVQYLPWFRLSNRSRDVPADAWMQIALRQLLHHTSGIAEYTGANTWDSRYAGDDALEQQVRSFANSPLAHTPGEVFEYSNANYEILGLIVQVVSGQSYESYIDEHIFRPLEMRHSYTLAAEAVDLASGHRYWFGWPFPAPNLPTPRAHGPSAMLVSTAEDMGHYLIAHMNGGKYGDVQILSAQGIAELHRPVAPIGDGNIYAMGWAVGPDGTLSHNGETPGFTSGIRIEGEWGVFVTRNIAANQREQRLDEIAPGILQIVRDQTSVRNTLDPSFRRKMVALAVLLVLQTGGVVWSLRRLRRWMRRPESVPHRTGRILWAVLPSLVVSLALAALLWYMGPVSAHRTFSVQALSAPDQMLLLGTNVVMAIGAAALQVSSGIWLWRRTG
jgi:CubicO group peptidase (beta-lactamase class C family)